MDPITQELRRGRYHSDRIIGSVTTIMSAVTIMVLAVSVYRQFDWVRLLVAVILLANLVLGSLIWRRGLRQ